VPSIAAATRRRRSPAVGVGVAVTLLTCLGMLTATLATTLEPASATTGARSASSRSATAATAVRARQGGTALVRDLALTGTRTRVVVGHVSRRGQALWIDHVLDARLVDAEGCQARRTTGARHAQVYRASVYAVCPSAPGAQQAAAKALVRDRPWYRVTVEQIPMVGFSLVADLPTGNDRAVPAALAVLPTGPAVFFEGDDVALMYAGPGVTQARLDAAVSAFASALGIPTSKVSITPLAAR